MIRGCATCLHCRVIADCPNRCRCTEGMYADGWIMRTDAEWVGWKCEDWLGEEGDDADGR